MLVLDCGVGFRPGIRNIFVVRARPIDGGAAVLLFSVRSSQLLSSHTPGAEQRFFLTTVSLETCAPSRHPVMLNVSLVTSAYSSFQGT